VKGSGIGFGRRGWIAIMVALGLTIASAGVALAASAGTYSGTAKIRVDGTTATHPFTLKVKAGKIVSLSLIATGNCGTLVASTSAPLKVSVPISANTFSSTITLSVGTVKGDSIKLAGRFKGAKVSGSFSGRLVESATNRTCPIVKQTFVASR
jgi:Flp pilus assembly protein TadG